MKKIVYLTPERIIEYNFLALTLLEAKKADKAEVLSKGRLIDITEGCQKTEGDTYDKAAYLLQQLIQQHPFASGNRRTAFIATKEFVLINKGNFGIKDDPEQARVMTGIREGFYTREEIKVWIKNGKIRSFTR